MEAISNFVLLLFFVRHKSLCNLENNGCKILTFFVREMSFQDLEAGRPLRSQRKLINGNKEGGTQAVASGIFEINTAVSTFQRLVNTLGTPKDTPDLRDKL